MDTIGDRIRYLRLSRNMTLEQLGNLVGVQKSAVLKWENGTVKNLKNDILLKLSDIFDVSVDYLTGNLNWEEYDKTIDIDKIKFGLKIEDLYGYKSTVLLDNYKQLNDDNKEKLLDISFDMIKENTTPYAIYVTEKVAAGNGYSYGNNESEPYYTDRDDLKDFDFATLITGDSMEPTYHDGDIILVKSGYDNVNGDVYVIDYDGQSYVKKLYNDGDRFRLVSINDEYEPIKIEVPPEDGVYFNIVGKVVDSFKPIEKF